MNRTRSFQVLTALAGATLGAIVSGASASELRLVSSPALRPAAKAIAAAFEKTTGNKVTLDFVNGEAAIKSAKEGQALDVTLQSAADIEGMEKAGTLMAGSAANLVTSRVALAVKAGAARPDISTPDALKKAMQNAGTIAYSSGTSGGFFMASMEKLGIADLVKAKAQGHVIRGSVGEAIARGEAEIGAQQYGELLPVQGIDILGLTPAEISTPIVYRVATGAKPADAAATSALVSFIKSEAASKMLSEAGFTPGK